MHCKIMRSFSSFFTLLTFLSERSLYFVFQNKQKLEVYTNFIQEVNLVTRVRLLKFNCCVCLFVYLSSWISKLEQVSENFVTQKVYKRKSFSN